MAPASALYRVSPLTTCWWKWSGWASILVSYLKVSWDGFLQLKAGGINNSYFCACLQAENTSDLDLPVGYLGLNDKRMSTIQHLYWSMYISPSKIYIGQFIFPVQNLYWSMYIRQKDFLNKIDPPPPLPHPKFILFNVYFSNLLLFFKYISFIYCNSIFY